MRYGINLNTVLPVRAEASDRSEMVTQLLFGEYCEITDEQNSFLKIRNHADKYIGWIDKKMLTEISEAEYDELVNRPIFKTCVPVADIFCMTEKSMYKLSAGSSLPLYNPETSSFSIANKTFQIHPSFVTYLPEHNKDNIIPSAMLFLNAPYLWGGKNIFGIDCSGFVQVIYSMCGYKLARDANQQILEGEIIPFDIIQKGDLFFFSKNEKISHVGINIGDAKIIHASGKVRIDRIDSHGIYNEDLQEYTHQLSAIRRL